MLFFRVLTIENETATCCGLFINYEGRRGACVQLGVQVAVLVRLVYPSFVVMGRLRLQRVTALLCYVVCGGPALGEVQGVTYAAGAGEAATAGHGS